MSNVRAIDPAIKQRSLHTRTGDVKLKVSKLGKITFESAIMERYKRREISVEVAMVEMYLAGVSVRRRSAEGQVSSVPSPMESQL